MAPLPVIASTYRCAYEWKDSATNQIAVNVIHIRKAGSTAAAVGALANSAPPLHWANCAVNTAQVGDIKVTPLDGSSATINVATTNVHMIGEQAGDFSPASAVVVSLGTGLRGRAHRGRVYMPFTGEAVISDGAISQSNATQLETAWNGYIAALAAGGAALVVASYHLASAADVTNVRVVPAIGTQRRRQQRVRYP